MSRYWRQFAGSATGWLTKYRDDPFFQTEVNVIVLQITFAFVILLLITLSFGLLNRDVSHAIVTGVEKGLQSGTPPLSIVPSVIKDIQTIRSQNLAMVTAIVMMITALFGYIVARITLAPARSALASQKQFIGNIAHELRTPLSIIKTHTEIALLDDGMTAELKQTLNSNIEELDRISEIINNLLSLSALIRPDRMTFSRVDLSIVVTDVIEKYARLAHVGGHTITVNKATDAYIWANETAIQQIVGNVLKNAISYTPRHGTITISTAPSPNGFVELSVQDSGIGIARKDLFRIFEPFYRTDQSRTRAQGGTGLGLAIVSELVKLHKGKINIRSAIGRGTTITVYLPAAPVQAKVGTSERVGGLNEVAVDFSTRTL